MSSNGSAVGQLLQPGSLCVGWRPDLEGAVYHLAHCFLLLGFMGGSGVYGCFYLFGFLGTGYLCCVLWGWFGACGLDVVLWSVLLAVACVLQLAHLLYRLREDALPEEFELLYKTLCLPLQVPLPAYREVVRCCEGKVLTLATEETYAVEGETPINRLSLLLSGRVRVSQDGQFLHYIFPYQFMDSPEWESLHPSEEGVFQVTLTAETECSYISWPRKSLHLLLTKERYLSRLFSALLGYDISEKLYALNDKLFAKFGLRFDIRLPSLYHVLGPAASEAGPESEKDDEEVREPAASPPQARPTSVRQTPPSSPSPAATNPPAPPPWARTSRPDSGVLGEDSTSLVLEDFEEVSGSESFMDYRSDGEYMR
ncbi:Popeye domain-containing protein 2 [Camelus dromedarius]|uniref:Popeye domain-containing protein 2 n=1 Tax=Camelus dromedarius TaxID=9838 RepID=A0A5N4EHX2_CAMDR|nr:popeye domain-containing protein 2 isoform X1 [Camelus dromedarius]XP_031311121.1 popeye domain-containing protein 2 isoform X1 [Camelus dromedarius]KAB1283108.1 Popeye domain-containing protein 2 [Camelus dromedarius]